MVFFFQLPHAISLGKIKIMLHSHWIIVSHTSEPLILAGGGAAGTFAAEDPNCMKSHWAFYLFLKEITIKNIYTLFDSKINNSTNGSVYS